MFWLFGFRITLELSGCASRSPLERLVMRAFYFGGELLFWHFWHWTYRASLPGLLNTHYRFLNQPNLVFLKPKRTDHHSKQTNWHYHQFHLPQKSPTETTTQKNNPRNRIFTKPGTNRSWFSCFELLDLHNAGIKRPRLAVRLNELLALPAGLQRTSVLTFGLWTEKT